MNDKGTAKAAPARFQTGGRVVERGAPMSAALAFILGAMVLLAVLFVIAIATWTGYRNTVDLLRQKAEIMVSSAVNQMHIHLEAAERQSGFVADAIARGETDPDQAESFVALLSGALSATPQITSIGFMNDELLLTAVEREEPAFVPVFAKLADDRSWRTRLEQVVRATDGYWAGLVWRHEYEATHLTRHQPVYRDGEFAGYVIVEVGTSSLSELIGSLESDFGLNAFILQDRRQVVAHPSLQFGFPGLTRWHRHPGLREIGDPVLMGIWDTKVRNPRVSGLLGTDQGHAIDLGDETYLFVYRETDRYGAPWLVGSYLAASDVLKEIERLFHAILACLVIVAMALMLAVWLGRRISRPVRLLAEQSRRVRDLEFDQVQPVPGSYIKEVNDAAAAFNQMVQGLQEKQLIRELFGKYVPTRIVEELLRDKGQLAPRSVEASILFVDLADFTSLAESLPPQKVMETLNAYFSGVAEIIEDHRGMITQFQGDAVLAVFNLPVADPSHPRSAVLAGKAIRRFVRKHRCAGRQLRCRIGINTGEVVAGNVGARDRLHYTVHGDAVNIAARLDVLNKELGTDLLVSAETARRLNGVGLGLREIGETRIRGKQRFIRVFEIP